MDRKFLTMTVVPPPPMRSAEGHKGTFGTVIVVGGSELMPGAPAICARAALRGGAGLVKIAAPRQALATALTVEPGATGLAWPVDVEAADPQGRSVLAAGPGLGTSEEAGRIVPQLLAQGRAMVLDADGLNVLADMATAPRRGGAPLILTPHPGEFRRLAQRWNLPHDPTARAQRPDAAAALAEACGAVVVLKGHRTVVSDGRSLYVNDTGNPALATAGSGDVLTGLIAALMAQGMSPLAAAVLGVWTHGRAGDRWAAEHGPRGLLARELADRLPDALQERAVPPCRAGGGEN